MAQLSPPTAPTSTDAAFDLLKHSVEYGQLAESLGGNVVLIPTGLPHTQDAIREAVEAGQSIALVWPDGSYLSARAPRAVGPRASVTRWLMDALEQLVPAQDRSAFVPRRWVTEFHGPGSTEPSASERSALPF